MTHEAKLIQIHKGILMIWKFIKDSKGEMSDEDWEIHVNSLGSWMKDTEDKDVRDLIYNMFVLVIDYTQHKMFEEVAQ